MELFFIGLLDNLQCDTILIFHFWFRWWRWRIWNGVICHYESLLRCILSFCLGDDRGMCDR